MGGHWTLPGYAEVTQLGVGGFGRVVLAKHEISGVLVAIKYLKAEFLTQPDIVAGFQREAWLLSGVRSPYVVGIRDFVITQDGAALVMEAVPGVSLQALLKAEPVLAPESALALLKGSLLGLAAAHSVGVVHRDYKPGNVLVSQERVSKLVDFGLATLDGYAGLAAGSPAYMAPEQWAGQPGTPATDVYAATCVFYECVTGRRPFDTTAEHVKAMHESAPVPLDNVPEPLRDLVARGMAKDTRARPASAGAFVAELEQRAVAAYGKKWEERGWQRLVASVATLVAMSPLALLTTTTSVGASTLQAAGWWTAAKLKIAAAAAGTAVVAGVGIVIYQGGDEDATAAPPSIDQTYVYTTDNAITVMRGTEVVRTVEAPGDDGGFYAASFTADGRYAYAVESGRSTRTITAIDTATGSASTVACHDCERAVPIGGSEVAWLTTDEEFLRVDLAAADPQPTSWPVRGPRAEPDGHGLALVTGTSGVALTADTAATGGDFIDAHLVRPGRDPRPVGAAGFDPLVDAAFSADGSRLAIVNAYVKTQECPDNARVTVVDVASGRSSPSTVIDPLPVMGDAGRGHIDEVWWSADNTLHASFMLCRETDGGGVEYAVQPGVWRLDGQVWRQTTPDPVRAVRPLGEDTRLVLAADGPEGRLETGTLYLERDGRRTRIAANVRTLDAARPTAMTGTVSTSAPPPADTTYSNARYGYTSLVPAGFAERDSGQNGDGATFTDADQSATMAVWGANNVSGSSVAETLAERVSAIEAAGGTVTYENAGADRYAVSGYLANGNIYYESVHVGPGSVAGLRWEYPKAEKEAMDAPVTATVAAFLPGDLSQPH
ncbi:protein kinase domain-containing protein [Actinophytocola sediminis]